MSCCAATTGNPLIVEEANANLARFEDQRIVSLSTKLTDGRFKTDFIVPAMHCAACIGSIERGLAKLKNVDQVRANLSLKTVSVIWDHSKGSASDIAKSLDKLGFENHVSDNLAAEAKGESEEKSLLLALAVAGFSAANIMLLSVSVWSGADAETAELFHLISGLIAIPAVMFSGRPFFASALKALSARRLNMDVPISLAVMLALLMSVYESLTGGEESYFDASVTLLFFLLIGRYLDQLMRSKARGAVERLHSLSVRDGILVGPDGDISHLDVNQIKPGMVLRVFPGERFPVNGTVLVGESDLDRSHVTGESRLSHTKPGDVVEAGTLNLSGPLDFEAMATAENSFLGEMRKMMEVAEQGRGSYVRIADRMAQIYAPAVHLIALVTFIGWMIVTGGDWHSSIYTAIAVLIITCPCALGLAVPVAHVIGANRLMQNGVLMRDGTALERLAAIDTVVFDKTGTLTTDRPVISSLDEYDGQTACILKALATKSSHPYAKAIDHFHDVASSKAVSDQTEIAGHGIEARLGDHIVRLGKPEWVCEITDVDIEHLEAGSVVFAIEGGVVARFLMQDSLRQDAKSTVKSLAARKFDLEILSGDQLAKVEQVADQLAIPDYRGRMTPADKIDRISAIREAGQTPLMVGDGINDAPALVAGYVSMVPASASDVGRHAADFVFVRPSLSAVPLAIDVARTTGRIVRQNFGIAIAYNCIAVPLAVAGYVTPLIAALAMSLSSIVVVANSFRISFARAGLTRPKTSSNEETVLETLELQS